MSPRTRRTVLLLSAPVVIFAVLGGFLSQATAREDTYQHLKVFEEVIQLISNHYVERVDNDKVMLGALLGLADTLDPDSAFLSADQVKQIESTAPLPSCDVGIDLTRRYYLQIIATRDGSPAAKAGLRTGDYVRSIGDAATRNMSVFEGMRLLRGAPGTKVKLTVMRGGGTGEPHTVELTREAPQGPEVTSRLESPGVGYLRISAIGAKTADLARAQASDLVKKGASTILVDIRRTSGGLPDHGLALARVFVGQGTLAVRETKGAAREPIAARPSDGPISQNAILLINNGTSGAAELFAAALVGNRRAELIGERTIGRAGQQRLIKLPDGTGLWLTTTRYLMPDGTPLHEKGLEPAVPVDEPDVDFGQTPPTGDPILEKALERAATRKAA
jgi:carboxyl-terminal processing protease